MKEAVVIKGNKAGMTVYLEKDLDFEKVLQAIAKKFKATAKFWGAAQMTLTLAVSYTHLSPRSRRTGNP